MSDGPAAAPAPDEEIHLSSEYLTAVVAVPVMAMTVAIAARPSVMGAFVAGPALRAVGWIATAVMALASAAMFATWGG